MAVPCDIQHDIDWQVQKSRTPAPCLTRPRFGSEWAAGYIRRYGLQIERLATGDESPAALRARLDAAYDAGAPATPNSVALIEQATVARIEIERLHQVRATLRADAIRTALLTWQYNREDEVRFYIQLAIKDANASVAGLKRSGAGMRHLISRWEYLSKCLSDEGTLYLPEKCEAIIMQGYAAGIDQLFLSEDAWKTWIDCLACQPVIHQADIDTICAPDVVPKSIQDRAGPL